MRQTNFMLITILLLALTSCSKENPTVIQNQENQVTQEVKQMSKAQIDMAIRTELNKKGYFSWNDASDIMLWSALQINDNILTVGYGTKAYNNAGRSKSDYKNSIIDIVRKSENISRSVKSNSLIIDEGETLNFVDVKVKSVETVKQLRASDIVRYIEPAGYTYTQEQTTRSSSGCNKSGGTIQDADHRLIAPNCFVSWAYDINRITDAWQLSTGQGITVAVIDTGISEYQPLLGSMFNNGYSSGRTIEKYGTYTSSWNPWSTDYDGPNDKCSHGTSMSANIASPRNNQGLPVGVAYNCNLVSYRGTADVVLNGYQEQRGVAKALTEIANRSDIKIISMSIGHIINIGKIEDAIKYAYSKDKLMFVAAGTSTQFTSWAGVTFPANMKETFAITGVTDGPGYKHGAVNHYGKEVDFTVIMERDSDNSRTSPTLGYYENERRYVGGSSISTSMVAGIAALVWERYPSYTRNQIVTKLKLASDLYPNRDDDYGYGNIDAYKAVQ